MLTVWHDGSLAKTIANETHTSTWAAGNDPKVWGWIMLNHRLKNESLLIIVLTDSLSHPLLWLSMHFQCLVLLNRQWVDVNKDHFAIWAWLFTNTSASDDWQSNVIKRIRCLDSETSPTPPEHSRQTNICTSAKAKGHFCLSAYMSFGTMLFDFRQLWLQHLNAGFRQFAAGGENTVTDSPCWPLTLSTDMPHLFTNPPTLGNAARSC